MRKSISLGLLGLGLIAVLAGCGSGQSASAVKTSSSAISGKISAVGSTALQPLVEQAAAKYQEENSGVTISVQGGGSGTGLGQVADGNVTVGNSDIFAEEKKGIDATKLVDHKVAVVGMGPVVNTKTGIKKLTQDQLISIFTGKVKNWKEVGGADLAITVINRAQGSGTRATFEKLALKDAKVITSQEQDSSGTVRQIVSQTPGAISYLAFSYFNKTIQAVSIDGVEPTEDNVAKNTWKIWSYEHMYTKGSPNAVTGKFIKYMQSKAIQDTLVAKLGYISMNKMTVERAADGTINETK